MLSLAESLISLFRSHCLIKIPFLGQEGFFVAEHLIIGFLCRCLVLRFIFIGLVHLSHGEILPVYLLFRCFFVHLIRFFGFGHSLIIFSDLFRSRIVSGFLLSTRLVEYDSSLQ
jgi:hypothetical protein